MRFSAIVLVLWLLCCFDQMAARPVVDHQNDHRTKANDINGAASESDFRKLNGKSGRPKREFDFQISAEHEDDLGTELTASASLNLYKSDAARLDGTASFSQRFDDMGGHGKAKYSGSLHYTHV